MESLEIIHLKVIWFEDESHGTNIRL